MNMSFFSAGAARMTLVAVALALLAACGGHAEGDGSAHDHGHGAESGEHEETGPHGGRLLEDGEFALEVTIFEEGQSPQFRLYPTLQGKPVDPRTVNATVELARITGVPGGAVERFAFTPAQDHLAGSGDVVEPHSFAVKVEASHAGKAYSWNYDSPEALVTIPAEMAQAQGVRTAIVEQGAIAETLSLYGRIQPNAERVRAVTARFPGVVQAVSVQVGDTVRAGQTLATVESNESLRSYAVTAPMGGIVVQRSVNPGETAGGSALFEIANFDSVWAELSVFPRDRGKLRVGQSVDVMAADGGATGSGKVTYISPLGLSTQALVARVVLANAEGSWTPGQFVNARVVVAQSAPMLVVPITALQSFRDWDVVALNDADRYQLQPVRLGNRDDRNVQVLDGLLPGARIVVENSFLVKADAEKSGASHDH